MSLHHSPRIVTDGLVLALDAADRGSYPGSGTTWYDLSGNGNDGALINGPTFDSGNQGSIVFDGSNDYVQTSLLFDKEDFAYCAWFKRTGEGSITGTGYEDNIIDSYESTSQEWARLNVNNGKISFHIDNNGIKIILQGDDVIDNVWYYACGVWVKNTGNMKLYINGLLNAETTHPNKNTIIATNPERIGAIATAALEHFEGSIPIAQVYNRALSPQEILQNYNATKTRFGL